MRTFYKCIKHYGLKGVWIYYKLKSGSTKRISLPKISYPIHIRKANSDISTFHQIFINLEYKIDIDFYPKTIIDAGANIGLAAIYFANKYPDSKIISIEPEFTNYQLLKKNVEYYQNIFPINKALSSRNELLNVIDHGFGHWGFMTSQIDEKDKKDKDLANSIDTITLPEIMTQNDIEYFDIVKIDIEGYEKELFESNFEDWLPKTRCLIIELHDRMKLGCSKSFFKCISQYDFSFFTKGENLVFMNDNLQTTHNTQ